MKKIFKFNLPAMLVAGACLGNLLPATARGGDSADVQTLVLTDAEAEAPTGASGQPNLTFRTITSDTGAAGKQEIIWLGVGVDETTEALASQLDLKPGEGLVVNYVATNSPAGAAGLCKNDVLVELDGQMLVDPAQLRKLVQMHAAGDNARIIFYRAGKKQTASAKLITKMADAMPFDGEAWPGGFGKRQIIQDLKGFAGGGSGGAGGSDNLNLEVQSAMAQAREAIEDAMKQASEKKEVLGRLEQDAQGRLEKEQVRLETIEKKLGNLAAGGVSMNKGATVVVKNQGESLRTMVKKDESGSYVIVADPAKHLTAHNAEGKLLFDGAVETPAEQEKVPKEVWKKVEPMLEDLKKDQPAGRTLSGGGGGSGGSSGAQQN